MYKELVALTLYTDRKRIERERERASACIKVCGYLDGTSWHGSLLRVLGSAVGTALGLVFQLRQCWPGYPNAEVAVVQLLAAKGIVDVFTTFRKPSEQHVGMTVANATGV